MTIRWSASLNAAKIATAAMAALAKPETPLVKFPNAVVRTLTFGTPAARSSSAVAQMIEMSDFNFETTASLIMVYGTTSFDIDTSIC